jgi:hypothetical protein
VNGVLYVDRLDSPDDLIKIEDIGHPQSAEDGDTSEEDAAADDGGTQ